MQAGGVFLAPTLSLLKQKNLLVPPTDPKHIFIISNDGIPAEFQAIKAGQIDATVSQPADLYAKYGLFYAQAAAEGKTFSPGPTDHNSTIIQLPERPGGPAARAAGDVGERRRPVVVGQPGWQVIRR